MRSQFGASRYVQLAIGMYQPADSVWHTIASRQNREVIVN